jgi:purine-binding chemotaxis protein CheW
MAAPTAAASDASRWLLCKVGAQLHAVPIAHVIEIMRALPIEPVAGAPAYVRGLCVIRGAPAPVVDVGLLVSHQATQAGRLVAIRVGHRTVALQVEAVLGIHVFGAETFDQLPPLLHDVATDSIAAIGLRDTELLFALRAARIVPESVFRELDRDGAHS